MAEIMERVLCPDCKKIMQEAHVVMKRVPNTEGTAACCWCHKRRYCTKYLVRFGKGDCDEENEAAE